MIEEPAAFGYIQQFSLMKHYPQRSDDQYQDRLDLLVRHFRRSAQDDNHGRRMVDWIQQNKRFCPEPVDIWDAAKATSGANVTKGERSKFRQCARCDEGFVRVFRHYLWSQDKRPTAGYVPEDIADDIHPTVMESRLKADPERYLTSQQAERYAHLRTMFPPCDHSRFLLDNDRLCPRCWGRTK